jgi:hypothetical protein
MTTPKEYRDRALECGKQAAKTQDEKLRGLLMFEARLWMETALELERSAAMQERDLPQPQAGLSVPGWPGSHHPPSDGGRPGNASGGSAG